MSPKAQRRPRQTSFFFFTEHLGRLESAPRADRTRLNDAVAGLPSRYSAIARTLTRPATVAWG